LNNKSFKFVLLRNAYVEQYGYAVLERCGFKNIHTFINHAHETTMDLTLAKTIEGLSTFIKTVNPGMIIVHGDR
jgi:UDP-N-acetylglucosamine 2-epimerase (hydrolysing)